MSHSTEYLSQNSFTQKSDEAEKGSRGDFQEKSELMSASLGHEPHEEAVLKEISSALKYLNIRSISFFHHSVCDDIDRSLQKAFTLVLDTSATEFVYFIKQLQFDIGEDRLLRHLSSPEPVSLRLTQKPDNDSELPITQEEGLFAFVKAYGPYGRSGIFILSLDPAQDDPSDTQLTPAQNIVQLFFPQLLQSRREAERLITLTPREKEIVKWISRGKSNPDIAQIIGISVHTVNGYLRGIYLKTQTGDRVSLSFFALHNGLLT